jgi:hypothetical protein
VPSLNAAQAVHNAYAWFETNGGWAPPDPDTLAEWVADSVCRCPDECLVAPEAWCGHGLASWWLILSTIGRAGAADNDTMSPEMLTPHRCRLDPDRPDYRAIIRSHQRAVAAGDPGYADPTTGLFVMTARHLWERGYCCDQGCRHCPFLPR